MTLPLPDPALILVAGIAEARLAERVGAWFDPEDVCTLEQVGPRLRGGQFSVLLLEDLDADTVDPVLVLAKKRHAVVGLVLVEDDTPTRSAQHRSRVLRARFQVVGERRLVRAQHRVAVGDEPEFERTPLPFDRRGVSGPFDVIGDVHGCADELEALLARLGYSNEGGPWQHPSGRVAVFVGDLVDRGPKNLAALERVMDMVEAGSALCVQGNHDYKFLRWLGHRKPKLGNGLKLTVDELLALPEPEQAALRRRAQAFLSALPSHLILDGGKLVVAHGGIREDLIGRSGGKIEAFTRYGATTGKTDEHGYPERLDWAADYTGSARIVYGHTPVPTAEWRNNTANVDQGCVFGGWLTAARYPELEFVQVQAERVHFEAPGKQFAPGHPQADL